MPLLLASFAGVFFYFVMDLNGIHKELLGLLNRLQLFFLVLYLADRRLAQTGQFSLVFYQTVAALKTGCLLVALVLLALLFLGSVLKLRALSEHTRTTYLVINLLAFSAKQAFVVAAIMYLWLLVKFDLVSLAHHQLI